MSAARERKPPRHSGVTARSADEPGIQKLLREIPGSRLRRAPE